MTMPRETPTPEQKVALENLDNAIRACWVAFGKSEPTERDKENGEEGWKQTPVEERMLTSWMVLAPISGNDEDQVDVFWPEFPPMPAWQSKGLLMEVMDQMRGDVP